LILNSLAIRNQDFKALLVERSNLLVDLFLSPALATSMPVLLAALGLLVNSDVLDGQTPDFQDALHIFLEQQPTTMLTPIQRWLAERGSRPPCIARECVSFTYLTEAVTQLLHRRRGSFPSPASSGEPGMLFVPEPKPAPDVSTPAPWEIAKETQRQQAQTPYQLRREKQQQQQALPPAPVRLALGMRSPAPERSSGSSGEGLVLAGVGWVLREALDPPHDAPEPGSPSAPCRETVTVDKASYDRAAALLPGLAFRAVLGATPRGLAAQGRPDRGLWLAQLGEAARVAKLWCFPRDGIPRELCCSLTGCLMKDPVRSRYGDQFEASAITAWLDEARRQNLYNLYNDQVHHENLPCCPIAKKPLALRDFSPASDLHQAAIEWRLGQAMERVLPSEVHVTVEIGMLDMVIDNHHPCGP